MDYIVRTKGVCGGEWRINGTRITVRQIQDMYYNEGESIEDILWAFPYLTINQIVEAIRFKL